MFFFFSPWYLDILTRNFLRRFEELEAMGTALGDGHGWPRCAEGGHLLLFGGSGC